MHRLAVLSRRVATTAMTAMTCLIASCSYSVVNGLYDFRDDTSPLFTPGVIARGQVVERRTPVDHSMNIEWHGGGSSRSSMNASQISQTVWRIVAADGRCRSPQEFIDQRLAITWPQSIIVICLEPIVILVNWKQSYHYEINQESNDRISALDNERLFWDPGTLGIRFAMCGRDDLRTNWEWFADGTSAAFAPLSVDSEESRVRLRVESGVIVLDILQNNWRVMLPYESKNE